MNQLVVGRHKHFNLPDSFLLVDDGDFIDSLKFSRRKVTHFDVSKHSFNPLREMNYRKAREFISVLDAIFPEGENTLTKKTSNFVLLNALLSSPRSLKRLIPYPKEKDPGQLDAYQKIQTLLLSPVLERVLTRPTNVSFDGVLLVRLNRAELGDFDCFVLANLLISQYRGTIVLPDFGFYACPFHKGLIRQNRLIAGINFFDEVPDYENALLLIEDRQGHGTNYDDAVTLARHTNNKKDSQGYTDFIETCMGV